MAKDRPGNGGRGVEPSAGRRGGRQGLLAGCKRWAASAWPDQDSAECVRQRDETDLRGGRADLTEGTGERRFEEEG